MTERITCDECQTLADPATIHRCTGNPVHPNCCYECSPTTARHMIRVRTERWRATQP